MTSLDIVKEALVTITSPFAPWAVMPDRFACYVGESVDCTPKLSLATVTTTLTREPSGATATVVSNAFTADKPGRYVVDLSTGGATRRLIATAFPTAIQSWAEIQYRRDGTTPRTPEEVRRILTALANCVGDTDYASLATLETATPVERMYVQQLLAAGKIANLTLLGA